MKIDLSKMVTAEAKSAEAKAQQDRLIDEECQRRLAAGKTVDGEPLKGKAAMAYVADVYAASWALKAKTPMPRLVTADALWPKR